MFALLPTSQRKPMHWRHAMLVLSSIVLLSATACRVQLITDYDKTMASQIDEVAKKIDHFYLTMQERPSEALREYSLYSTDYVDIEVELNALYQQNRVKPLNENSTRICEIALQLWQKYKEEHRTKRVLSAGVIKLNRMTFNDLFYAMKVAEEGKKVSSNPPE